MSTLTHCGAILLRGFPVNTPEDFDVLFKSFNLRPTLHIGGSAPGRDRVTGDVFTSTNSPKEGSIWMHNEMSYLRTPPQRVLFCSMKPAEEGGYTPIANFKKVLSLLDPVMVDTLKKRQISYTRMYVHENLKEKYIKKGSANCKSWQEAFMTKDPKDAEAACSKSGFSKFRWTDEGLFCQTIPFPPTTIHPITGEEVWFNQIQGWDPRMRITTYLPKPELLSLPYEELYKLNPGGCLYADTNTPIDLEYLKHIHDVTWNLRVEFPWQVGDVLLLDNYSTAHSRTSYKGERLLLAVLA